MKTEMMPDLHAELSEMLSELEAYRLEVALVPQKRFTNVGGMIRVAVCQNAKWYRDFCAAHSSRRVRRKAASDTRIKRAGTVRALVAMLSGEWRSDYCATLAAIARSRMQRKSGTGLEAQIIAARRRLNQALG